jgi:hypothetical protein
MFQKDWTNQISNRTTPKFFLYSMLVAAFSSVDKINSGSLVGILCIVNTILIELCFIMISV